MSLKNDVQLKRFRNIYNNSGCVSANYNIKNNDIEVSHVEDSINEFSGEFKFNKVRRKK